MCGRRCVYRHVSANSQHGNAPPGLHLIRQPYGLPPSPQGEGFEALPIHCPINSYLSDRHRRSGVKLLRLCFVCLFLYFYRKIPPLLHRSQHVVIFLHFLHPHLVFRQHLHPGDVIMLPGRWDGGGLLLPSHHPLPPRRPSPTISPPAPQAAGPEKDQTGVGFPLHPHRR